jgi:predicted nucleic acid-binding protein
MDLETHTGALALAQRYGFSFYRAVMVASAIKGRCDILHSEGMQ